MGPYFSYLQYTDSEYQGATGTIIGVQSLEGVGTVTVNWTGPNGYTAGPFTMPTHPDLTGLEPGTYTGTIIDSNLDETTLDIVVSELAEVILTASDTNLCDCKDCDGIVDITNFVYNSNCFTYNLYNEEDLLVDSYTSCDGQVQHTFSGLCPGQYHLEAVETDCLIYTYSNPDNCSQEDVVIGGAVDVEAVVANWRRFALQSNFFDFFLNFTTTPQNGVGPTLIHIIVSNNGGWSGLKQDGTIDYHNIRAFFYIGTNTLLTPDEFLPAGVEALDPEAPRFLGSFSAAEGANTRDGEDPTTGLGIPVPSATQRPNYWFNNEIGKFMYCEDMYGASGTGPSFKWATFDPIDEITVSDVLLPPDPHVAWPNAQDFYTTDSQWDTPNTDSFDYTIDPTDNNRVKLASALIPPVNKKIQCTANSIVQNGFFSDCKYLNYTHEITIGSSGSDDDIISIILARHIDDDGHTHLLTLDFSMTPASVSIGYNSVGLGDGASVSSLSFNNGLEVFTAGAPGNPDILNPDFQSGEYIIKRTNGIGTAVPNIPLANGLVPPNTHWGNVESKVRVKIERSGVNGEAFFIQMTDTMGGTAGIGRTFQAGDINDYNSAYNIFFDLTDISTWVDRPVFTQGTDLDGTELEIFLGPTNYGYATYSQEEANFYHINFQGEQTNTTDSRIDCEVITEYDTENCNIYRITSCTDSSDERKIRVPGLIVQPILDPNKIYKFNLPGEENLCWEVEPILSCEQDTVQADPLDEYQSCDECNPPQNTCWDLVNCNGDCPDILSISSFDFTPYVGSLVTVNNDQNCVFSPVELRQSSYMNLKTNSLSDPTSPLQTGVSDLTVELTSLVLDGTERISGAAPMTIVTAANYNTVECDGFICVPVSVNTTENGFTNIPDFLNVVFTNLGLELACYNADPRTCDVPGLINEEIIKIQYRDGHNFTLILNVIYAGLNYTITLDTTGNVSTQIIDDTKTITNLTGCNTTFYCTDPTPDDIDSVQLWDAQCPTDLGESCNIAPRLGEPGFSTKNCDPKKVIDVKTKFADSVYAWFKRARYGIDTCCEYDLDQIDIKNQLIDLGSIYDPDMCIDGDPVVDCCPQPCNAVVTLEIPEAITCPAPEAPVSAIVVPGPPTPAPCGAPTNMDGNPKAVRGRVYITGDSCLTVELLAINNGSPSTYMATACDSSPINENLVVGQPAVVLCVDPTQPITNNNVQATYTGLCV
jgi:hypothetical protein